MTVNMKYFLFSVLLLFSVPMMPADSPETINVAAFNFYPAIFEDADGEVKGFYVDVLNEIGAKENIKFNFVFGSWNEGLEKVKTGEVDLLTSVAYTAERAAYLDYGSNPLQTVWGELYTLRSSEIDSILEVEGRKVGILKNDFNGANFMDLASKFGITCSYAEFASFEDVFKAVQSGKVDCGVSSVVYGSAMQNSFGLRSTGVIFNPFNIYFAVGKGKNSELLALLDRYLAKWKHQENSPFIKARQKWTHGSTGYIEVFPVWLEAFLAAVFILGILSVLFIMLLRHKISKVSEKYLESEQIFSQFLQHSPIYIFFKDSEIRPLRLSANYEQMLGRPVNELIGKTMYELFPSELAKTMIEDDKKILNSSDVVTIDEDLNGRKYTTIKFSFENPDRKRYIAGFTIDVTDRKMAEEKINALLAEKELLLKEVHHRIKNNMTTVKGLLALQIAAEKNASAVESLKDAESRVHSIMMLYDRLYCTDNYRELDMSSYLVPLVHDIVNGYSHELEISTHIEIEPLLLNLRLLSPLGIIINETITNMMKHAFTGMNKGNISVSARHINNELVVSVSDDGVGLPAEINFDNSGGFGMQIISMLTKQINGRVEIVRGGGTKFVFVLKI